MAGIVLVALQFIAIIVLLWPGGGAPNAVALALVAIGIALGGWALASNRPGNFNIRPDPKAGGRLIAHGAYRYVRHPMYVALLVAGAGLVLRDPRWWRLITYLALAVVLDTKARFEERGMRERHADYAAYCARTPRWLPFTRRGH